MLPQRIQQTAILVVGPWTCARARKKSQCCMWLLKQHGGQAFLEGDYLVADDCFTSQSRGTQERAKANSNVRMSITVFGSDIRQVYVYPQLMFYATAGQFPNQAFTCS
jgi:hypothetical protein